MSAASKKHTKIISIVAVVVFLAIAGLTTYFVTQLSSRANDVKVSEASGLPESWNGLQKSSFVEVNTIATASEDYISYQTIVDNIDPEENAMITKVAAYIEGENSGFLPFNASSLEYTYTPDQAGSWTPASIASDQNAEDGFKLESPIYLGNANSTKKMVYFRYNLVPSAAGKVSDNIAFVVEETDGDQAITTANTTVDFEPTNTAKVAATDSSEDSADAAFAKPLGVTTADPDTSAIPLATVGVISVPADNQLLINLIIIASCVGVFVITMIIYLIVRRRTHVRTQ